MTTSDPNSRNAGREQDFILGESFQELTPSEQLRYIERVHTLTERSASILDSYSGWLLAGFGAAVALLLSNAESLDGRITAGTLDLILKLFLCSAICALLAKVQFKKISDRLVAFRTAGLESLADKDFDTQKREVDSSIRISNALLAELRREAPPHSRLSRWLWSKRPRFLKGREEGPGGLRRLYWLNTWTFLQFIFLLLAVIALISDV